MRAIVHALLAASFSAVGTPALAQTFPTKPVRFVVAFSAGGPSDTVARAVGRRMSDLLGQPVVVENRPGAGGIIGTQLVAKAPPDGHTLLHGGGYLTIAPGLYKSLPYTLEKDFVPVGLIVSTQFVLISHPSVPARSLRELITLAKARPGVLNLGSAGSGSPPHLAGELMKTMAKINLSHVAYKGATPALTDVIGGHIDLYFCGISAAIPPIKAGQVRALAVTSWKRSSQLPDVATMAEAGLPGYDITTWFGLLAPAGTPRAIVERLNRAIGQAVTEPELRSFLRSQGVEASPSTPEEFSGQITKEIRKFTDIVRTAGIQPE